MSTVTDAGRMPSRPASSAAPIGPCCSSRSRAATSVELTSSWRAMRAPSSRLALTRWRTATVSSSSSGSGGVSAVIAQDLLSSITLLL
jgi:hypothetical protein